MQTITTQTIKQKFIDNSNFATQYRQHLSNCITFNYSPKKDAYQIEIDDKALEDTADDEEHLFDLIQSLVENKSNLNGNTIIKFKYSKITYQEEMTLDIFTNLSLNDMLFLN